MLSLEPMEMLVGEADVGFEAGEDACSGDRLLDPDHDSQGEAHGFSISIMVCRRRPMLSFPSFLLSLSPSFSFLFII